MIQTIILSLVAGIGGLWVATKFVPGVSFEGSWQTFLMVAGILGAILIVVKPILSFVSFLLRVIILGAILFGVVWGLDVAFPELNILGLVPLAWTVLAIGGASIILSLLGKGKL
ncbi:MAG: phage holin family protein [Candidatus Wildermuthbacteria bacterium]|nr:phage holin family protein [Candidatus Wildermuthbacteria bacterium]